MVIRGNVWNSEAATEGGKHHFTISVVKVQGAPQAPVPGRNQVENEGDPAPLQLIVMAEQSICNHWKRDLDYCTEQLSASASDQSLWLY